LDILAGQASEVLVDHAADVVAAFEFLEQER